MCQPHPDCISPCSSRCDDAKRRPSGTAQRRGPGDRLKIVPRNPVDPKIDILAFSVMVYRPIDSETGMSFEQGQDPYFRKKQS
jgi:hypothetical protein